MVQGSRRPVGALSFLHSRFLRPAHIALCVVISQMVDATGAGDAFFGGMLASLYHFGLPEDLHMMKQMAKLASAAGAVNCLKIGALPEESSARKVMTMVPDIQIPLLRPPSTVSPSVFASKPFSKSLESDASELNRFSKTIGSQQNKISTFVDIVLKCVPNGRLYFTGIGKSGSVAQRAASSLVSVGFPAEFVSASDWFGCVLRDLLS